MIFMSIDNEIAAARERLHRQIGQRTRRAKEDLHRMYLAAAASLHPTRLEAKDIAAGTITADKIAAGSIEASEEWRREIEELMRPLTLHEQINKLMDARGWPR